MDIRTLIGNQENERPSGTDFSSSPQPFFVCSHQVPSLSELQIPGISAFFPLMEFPTNCIEGNSRPMVAEGIASLPPILLSPLPPVREMLKGVSMENDLSVIFQEKKLPRISEEKLPTSIFTENVHLQIFNQDNFPPIIEDPTFKLEKMVPKNGISTFGNIRPQKKFHLRKNTTQMEFPVMEKYVPNGISVKKNPEKKNQSETYNFVITEAGFTEKHIPNGSFPIILEQYSEKQILMGQFEIDFSQITPEEKSEPGKFGNSGNINSGGRENTLDFKKRKFSETKQDSQWNYQKLLNIKGQYMYNNVINNPLSSEPYEDVYNKNSNNNNSNNNNNCWKKQKK